MVICIVEDHDSCLRLYSDLLTAHGFKIITFTKGQDFLRNFEHLNYDLLILDIRLPDISGLEILKKIKESNHQRKVIVASAFAMQEEVNKF